MSLEDLRNEKLQSVFSLIGSDTAFQFAESLKASFDPKGKRETVEPIWLKKDKPQRLEPVIIVQDRIKPKLTQAAKSPELTTSQGSDVSLADVSDLSQLINTIRSLNKISNSQNQSQESSAALHELANLPYAKLEAIIPALEIGAWTDDMVSNLLSVLTDIQYTANTTPILLLNAIVFSRIASLTTSAPRLLLNSLIQLAKVNGRCIVYGLLLPLLFQSDMKKPQAELVSKVSSEALNPLYKSTILQAIVSDGETYFTSNLFIFPRWDRRFLKPWSNEVFQVLQSLCTSQPLITFTKPLLFELLNPLKVIVQANPKDKPSMQLLLAITSKYAQTLVESNGVPLVEAICETSTMFLKRAVLAQLASMKKNMSSTDNQ